MLVLFLIFYGLEFAETWRMLGYPRGAVKFGREFAGAILITFLFGAASWWLARIWLVSSRAVRKNQSPDTHKDGDA